MTAHSAEVRDGAGKDYDSVLALIQQLVRIPLVQAVYHEAVLTLLTTEAGADAAKR